MPLPTPKASRVAVWLWPGSRTAPAGSEGGIARTFAAGRAARHRPRWMSGGSDLRLRGLRLPLRLPEAKASEERELVVAPAGVRRQLRQVLDSAAPDDDVVGLHRGGEAVDDLEHALLPLGVTDLLQRALLDVVLEGLVLVRQVAELERLDHAVGDQRRAEAGAEPQEEHPSALVASDRLHDGVVDDLGRLAERRLEVEPDPALAEVHRLGDHLAAVNRGRYPHAHVLPRPALGGREHTLDHLRRRQLRPGLEPPPLRVPGDAQLDVRPADVDGEHARILGDRIALQRCRLYRASKAVLPVRWRASTACADWNKDPTRLSR